MKSSQNHYFPITDWETDPSKMSGLRRAMHQEGHIWNCCTRCGTIVKQSGKSRGGVRKFFVNGQWVSETPPCEVPGSPEKENK